MSKLQFFNQWKSAGRRFPCCKFEDGKETYKQRNRKIRHAVTRKLHQLHTEES